MVARVLRRQAGRQAGFSILALTLAMACSGPGEPTSRQGSPLQGSTLDAEADTSSLAREAGSTTTTEGGQPLAPVNAPDPPSFQLSAAPGTALAIGVGDASPWIVGQDQTVYHYNNDSSPPRAWTPEGGSSATYGIAVSPEGTPWRVDSAGHVWERTGSGVWAEHDPAFSAHEIGVGRNRDVWAISSTCHGPSLNTDCDIYYWNGAWNPIGGGAAAQHVAVSPEGNVYVTNSYGTI